jgi:VWFA-related protein
MTRRTFQFIGVLVGVGSVFPIAHHVLSARQQTPVFRAGVDLITVDVLVLDKSGKQVTTLTAPDFTVTAGGKVRRIVSAEYVPARMTPPTPGVSAELPPAPESSSNMRPVMGRSVIFAVDVEEIRAGEGRGALKSISDYLDKLSPDDRVGLVSLPYGSPRADLTTNRGMVRDAAALIAGASNRARDPHMTPGEATQIYQKDVTAVVAYWERTVGLAADSDPNIHCAPPGPRPFDTPGEVSQPCVDDARRALDVHRRHTAELMSSLAALARAMTSLPGPKAIVLVSEGLFTDRLTRDSVAEFAQQAERSRTSLYALHLDPPLSEAAAGTSSATVESRSLDDRLGFDSMAEVAAAARGTAFRVVGIPTNTLRQIDTELSGYYLLSFERSADDRDGKRVGIDVKVNKPGLDVRARREATPEPANATAALPPAKSNDSKVTMGELLHWPTAISEIGVDLDTAALPVDGSATDARTIITAEIASASLSVVGFEITDDKGTIVSDTFDAKPAAQPLPDGRVLYPAAVAIPAGHYRMKFGVIDAAGKRGSLEHAFDVPAWPAGAIRVGDLIVGIEENDRFRPAARIGADATALRVRVEMQADAAERFADARATLQVLKPGGLVPVVEDQVPLAATSNPLRRAIYRPLAIETLPAGEYVVRVTITSGGAMTTRMRMFRKS